MNDSLWLFEILDPTVFSFALIYLNRDFETLKSWKSQNLNPVSPRLGILDVSSILDTSYTLLMPCLHQVSLLSFVWNLKAFLIYNIIKDACSCEYSKNICTSFLSLHQI